LRQINALAKDFANNTVTKQEISGENNIIARL
jgi:hypothetical protein